MTPDGTVPLDFVYVLVLLMSFLFFQRINRTLVCVFLCSGGGGQVQGGAQDVVHIGGGRAQEVDITRPEGS